MRQETANSYFKFVTYFLGFLLLWEWLKPLKVVTDTASLTYFIVFIALALTLSYIRFIMRSRHL